MVGFMSVSGCIFGCLGRFPMHIPRHREARFFMSVSGALPESHTLYRLSVISHGDKTQGAAL